MRTLLGGCSGIVALHYESQKDVFHVVFGPGRIDDLVHELYATLLSNGLELKSIGLPRREAPDSLAAMAAQIGERGSARLLISDARFPTVAPFSLSLEQWTSAARDGLTARSTNLLVSRIWHPDADAPSGAFELSTLLPGPPLNESRFEIDWVFSWVDGTDPEWLANFRTHAPARMSDATDRSRFEHRNDLLYALRGLSDFAPWIRRIYVVSDCRPPAWLDLGQDKIRWVDLTELFEPDHLPVFNSHAIETTLHRIPDLSEYFVYSNDDFYLARRTTPGDFFTPGGLCIARLEPFGMVNGAVTEGDPDYINGARNAAALLLGEFGAWPTQLHSHAPMSLRRSVYAEMEEKFQAEIERTRSTRFRSATDVNSTSFMFHHYAIATGRGVAADPLTRLVQQNHNYPERFRELLRERTRWGGARRLSFCVNDGHGSLDNEDWNTSATAFLEKYFPNPSPFEQQPVVADDLGI